MHCLKSLRVPYIIFVNFHSKFRRLVISFSIIMAY